MAARYFPALLGAVSSPRGPLTAVFGMGTGVSARQWPPTKVFRKRGAAMKPAGMQTRGPRPCPLPRRGEPTRGGEAGKPHGLSEPLG